MNGDDATYTSGGQLNMPSGSHSQSGTFHITELLEKGGHTHPDQGLAEHKLDMKLPNGYNVVAVRETLLSEASFVTRTSKGFWRRMMDNEQFVTMFTAGFHHVVECISDNGMILAERLTSVGPDNAFVAVMSTTLADMYFRFRRGDRDVFLPRLPELLCFMIVNALQAAVPKHQRVVNSARFRELIIDWSTELCGGIRSINCRTGKEWFFQDASDMPVMVSSSVGASPAALAMAATLAKRTAAVLPLNSVGSRYHLDHSPLVAMYIDKNNPSLASATAKNVLHVTLSHRPERPLLTLQEGLVKTVKFREKKVDVDEVRGLRREATLKRAQIMREFAAQKAQVNEDVAALREGMRESIAMLAGRPGKTISRKKLLAAALVTGGK